jgi:hypothetical protein
MTSSLPQTTASQLKGLALPPLENGDRLTRPEFERRYHAMPKLKKAELIEGVVYIPHHYGIMAQAKARAEIVGWLGRYTVNTPRTTVGVKPSLRLDLDNKPQPVAVLIIEPSFGGRVRFSEDDILEGSPELVVEVAASSTAIDLGDKKRAYRRSGVQEYIVWQVYDQKIDWFQLQDGDYVSLAPDEQGVVHSQVFPGLWLNVEAMLQGDMRSVLAVLQMGIDTKTHQAFVQQLEDLRDKTMQASDRQPQ